MLHRILLSVFTAALSLSSLGAQTAPPSGRPPGSRVTAAGSINGTVKDATGGIIPGATVTLSNAAGLKRSVQSGVDGGYSFRGVPPGSYTVLATYSGLQQPEPLTVNVQPNSAATGNLTMTIQVQKQEVTVTDNTANAVSTDPANNATALVLKPEDLDALPDDPDDLQADLQALAGPGAGPGGNQIYIDGFTGGSLPPKESIREIRINSNPFSAEYDKVGFGRIQIFTKPGSDKFHGQGFYQISDSTWNSRNPFSNVNPPFRSQMFGGNVSGPIGKNASFFLDVDRRNIDDNGIIVATIPTANLLFAQPYSAIASNFYPTPQRRTSASPRLDYQLNANNTLSVRYRFVENDKLVTGVGSFDTPGFKVGNLSFASPAYSSSDREQTAQVVETAVLSAKAIMESRFQFDHEVTAYGSQSEAPTLSVGQAFVAGGSGYTAPGYGSAKSEENGYELQNYTSLTLGSHTTKFGIRVRASLLSDLSPKSYNGTFQFLGGTIGGTKVQSIDQFLVTEQMFAEGMSSQAIAQAGYGPSKYQVNAGNPYISFYQMDFGPFFQDDWKVRPNLTVSYGLRWESQTNIPNISSWAPRFALAWSPDGNSGNRRPKTVIRAGWGIFYDRFSITNVETAYRYSSGTQQTYQLNNPLQFDPTFSTPLPLSQLSAVATANQRFQIDSALQAPRLMQTAVTLERQITRRTNLTVSFNDTRGTHQLRTVDINAPVPVVGQLPPGTVASIPGQTSVINTNNTGLRPYGNAAGDIYNYESDGILKQTQVGIGLNSQVGKWLTLFTRYSYLNSHSDTDGLSSVPANPYDFKSEWGRSNLDINHTIFVGGSVAGPWGLRLSPFLVAHSGQPFNITTGTDLYQQGSITPTARPALLAAAENLSSPASYNSTPLVGAPIIPRNFGVGAGYIGLNMRLSKTWGFGSTKFSGPSGGARAEGGGGGGRRGGPGGGFGGPGGGFGGESTSHRYNLTLSLNARNVLNHENLNTFNGALTSPYFFHATNITGGFGAEATASNQRRMDIQLRFAF